MSTHRPLGTNIEFSNSASKIICSPTTTPPQVCVNPPCENAHQTTCAPPVNTSKPGPAVYQCNTIHSEDNKYFNFQSYCASYGSTQERCQKAVSDGKRVCAWESGAGPSINVPTCGTGCHPDQTLDNPHAMVCPQGHDCLVLLGKTQDECNDLVNKTLYNQNIVAAGQFWPYSQTKGDSLDTISSACIVSIPKSSDSNAVDCYANDNTTWDTVHKKCVCHPGYKSSVGSTTCEAFYTGITNETLDQLTNYYPTPCVLGEKCDSQACGANEIPTVDHTRCVSLSTATNVQKIAAGYTSFLCVGISLNASSGCSCSDLDKPVGPLQNRPQCSGDWWEMDSCDTKFKGGECWKDNPGSPDPCKPGPGQVEWCTQQAAIGFPTDVGCDTNPTTKKPWCSPEHEATNYRPLIMLAGILGDFL
jgi:hypothetical protein